MMPPEPAPLTDVLFELWYERRWVIWLALAAVVLMAAGLALALALDGGTSCHPVAVARPGSRGYFRLVCGAP